jgi:hypothetical protein
MRLGRDFGRFYHYNNCFLNPPSAGEALYPRGEGKNSEDSRGKKTMFEFIYGKSDEEFLDGAETSYTFLDANYERLGLKNPGPKLAEPLANYRTALAAAKDKNTGVAATNHKNATRKVLKDAFIAYGNLNMYNPNVTDEDKRNALWHIRKTPSSITPPDTVPVVVVLLASARRLIFKYYAKVGAKRMGKPNKSLSFVVYWVISDTRPTDLDQLVHRITDTNPPLEIDFKESDRGKKLWFVTCWAIEHEAIEGPKSEMEFVIIP